MIWLGRKDKDKENNNIEKYKVIKVIKVQYHFQLQDF